MIGAGTFINPLLKIVTTVAVLGAAYLFIVKPVLDTTESVSHDLNRSIHSGMSETNQALQQSGVNSQRTQHRVRVQVRKTIKSNGHVDTSGLPPEAARVLKCIQRANGNINKIQACNG